MAGKWQREDKAAVAEEVIEIQGIKNIQETEEIKEIEKTKELEEMRNMEETDATFGEKLKRLRKQQGYTQGQLADALYISRQTISGWEQEKIQPDLENIKRISRLFDVPVEYLLGKNEQKEKDSCPEEKVAEIWEDKERIKRALLACLLIIAVTVSAYVSFFGIFVCVCSLFAARKWKLHSVWLYVIIISCLLLDLRGLWMLAVHWMTDFSKSVFQWTL